MRWTILPNGKHILDHTIAPIQTTIMDSNTQQHVPIKEIPTNQHHKTLGIHESPDGNNTAELKRLGTISAKFARIITTATANYRDTELMYFAYFLTSISYALTVGTHTKDELHKLQSPVTHAILPSLGFNRSFPLEMVFGPRELGGKGLRHLFPEQGTLKVRTIMKHIRTNRPTGKIIQIKLLWDQRISGQGHSILQPPFYEIPSLTNERWTTTL